MLALRLGLLLAPLLPAGDPLDPTFESYLAHLAAANGALRAHDAGGVRRWLDGAPAEHRGWEWRYLDGLADGSAAVVELGVEQHTLACSPDGRRIASGGADGVVRILDARTRALERSIPAHAGAVYGLSFSPDSSRLASSSADARAKLFDVESGSELAVFAAHTHTVSSVAFSPDGALVASSSYQRPSGGEVRVWSVEDASEVERFQAGYAPITCVAWCPDGDHVHAGSWAAIYATFELGGGEPRVLPVGDDEEYRAVNALATSPDGALVALGGKDDEVHVFEAESGAKLHALVAHDRPVWGLAFAPDGATLASGSQDGTICIWDARAGRLVARLLGHRSSVRGLAFTPDGATLLSAASDGTLRVWDAVGFARASGEHAFGDAAVYYACESPDGALVAAAFHDGRVLLLDASGGNELRALAHDDWVNWLDFSSDGARLLTAGGAGLSVWDPKSGERRLAIAASRGVECAMFSPDGTRIASGARDSTARVFDAESGAEIFKLPHAATVNEIAFAPDGQRLLTIAYQDPKVRVWELATGALALELDGPVALGAAAYSPDGALIATAGVDGSVRFYDSARGTLLGARPGHDGEVSALAFHPSGARLATGGDDYRIVLWDVAAREPVLEIDDRDPIYALRFSADGEHLLAVPLEHRFRVLDGR